MSRPSKPFKPFSTPSWDVGRDFPDPNTRPPSSVSNGPTGFTDSIPICPSPLYPDEGRATPALYPDEGRAADPQQPAAPLYPDEGRAAAPKPRKTHTAAKSNLEHPTSNFHSGKCSVCNHPDRAEIEAAFLNWEPAQRIVEDFNLPARSTIYRHAKAADLLNQRRDNLGAALDHIIERAAHVPATASGVLGAIELSCRLRGANIAPLKRYETTHIYVHEPNPSSGHPKGESTGTPAARPHLEPSTRKQSGHANIVAAPNSLNSKEGH